LAELANLSFQVRATPLPRLNGAYYAEHH
jgi:hypothetical protein